MQSIEASVFAVSAHKAGSADIDQGCTGSELLMPAVPAAAMSSCTANATTAALPIRCIYSDLYSCSNEYG